MKKEIKNNRGRKGQIAIFVIIALILVVSILGIFAFLNSPLNKTGAIANPTGFISECVEEAGEEALEIIGIHGGYIEAPELSMFYDDGDIAYLCYVEGERKLCVNKEPMLATKIEQEINDYITPRIENCFESLENSLSRYNPELGEMNLKVEVIPNNVLIKIDRRLSFVRNEQPQNFEVFDVSIPSPMFDFSRITLDIINDELNCQCGVESCNADIIDLASKNRDFDIEKFVTSGNEEAYKLREVISEKEFTFAIRNCIRFE